MSGSCLKNSIKGNKGPIKTILIGNRIVAAAFFQAIGEPVLRKDSLCEGKSLGPDDPNSVLEIKRNINPAMRKKITNFVLEVFIASKNKIALNVLFCKYSCFVKGIRTRCVES